MRSTSTAAKPRIVNSEGSPPASRHRIRGRHGSLPRLSTFLPHMRSATPKQAADGPLRTPDGRYLVVCGRLWRATNPDLPAEARDALVHALMDARRAVKAALRTRDAMQRKAARGEVDAAKTGLGERGAVWWNDGAPDFNRHLMRTARRNRGVRGVHADSEHRPPPPGGRAVVLIAVLRNRPGTTRHRSADRSAPCPGGCR